MIYLLKFTSSRAVVHGTWNVETNRSQSACGLVGGGCFVVWVDSWPSAIRRPTRHQRRPKHKKHPGRTKVSEIERKEQESGENAVENEPGREVGRRSRRFWRNQESHVFQKVWLDEFGIANLTGPKAPWKCYQRNVEVGQGQVRIGEWQWDQEKQSARWRFRWKCEVRTFGRF